MKILLDTNAYSDWKRGVGAVSDYIRQAEAIVFSGVVAGELLFGFRRGNRFEKNWDELKSFMAHPRVFFHGITIRTADRYGRVAEQLRRTGRPIPTNDIWIAAQALETGADLISSDPHFAKVEGLVCIQH